MPAYISDCDGGDLDDCKDTHPVQKHPDRLTSTSNTSRADFSWVQPRDWQPADAEEALKEEDHGGGTVRRASGSDGQEDGSEREAYTEPGGGEHEEGATAETVDSLGKISEQKNNLGRYERLTNRGMKDAAR